VHAVRVAPHAPVFSKPNSLTATLISLHHSIKFSVVKMHKCNYKWRWWVCRVAAYRRSGGLTAQVDWLGLRIGSQLAPNYIHQMKRMNSRKWLSHGDSTINIDLSIIVIIIIITTIIRCNLQKYPTGLNEALYLQLTVTVYELAQSLRNSLCFVPQIIMKAKPAMKCKEYRNFLNIEVSDDISLNTIEFS